MMIKTLTKICAVIMLVMSASLLLVACNKDTGPKYKVEFMVDGTVYATVKTDGNESITLPTAPTKSAMDFAGWWQDDNVWSIPFNANTLTNLALANNLRVYAKWVSKDANTTATFGEFWEADADDLLYLWNEYGYEPQGKLFLHIIRSGPDESVTLDFNDVVNVGSQSTWKLFDDITAQTEIAKTATLDVGVNFFWVLVTAANGNTQLYALAVLNSTMVELERVYAELVEFINEDIVIDGEGRKTVTVKVGDVYHPHWRVLPMNTTVKDVEFTYDIWSENIVSIMMEGASVFVTFNVVGVFELTISTTDGTNLTDTLYFIVGA